MEELLALRERCLGPRDERSAGPRGTVLERDDRFVPVQHARCVSFGLQTQTPKSLVNPAVGGKFTGQLDEGLILRRDVVEVSGQYCYLTESYSNSCSSSLSWVWNSCNDTAQRCSQH